MEDPSKWVEDEPRWDIDKHYEERKTQGFSKADWINFDTYIAWVIASAVQKMKDEGSTCFYYPDEPEANWEALTNAEYDIMIEGFGTWAKGKWELDGKEAQQEAVRNLEDALEIFKNRFKSLWD